MSGPLKLTRLSVSSLTETALDQKRFFVSYKTTPDG